MKVLYLFSFSKQKGYVWALSKTTDPKLDEYKETYKMF